MSDDRTDAPPAPELYCFGDNGAVPNNETLPLVLYRGVLPLEGDDPAAACERLFAGHGWSNGWRNGIFPYHHFHTGTHEVLGIVRGEAKVRFGGEGGELVPVRAGDVVVIPAGVGHRNEGASRDLLVVGAYPGGAEPDIRKGDADDPAAAKARIRRVALPAADPVFGRDGPLLARWTAQTAHPGG